MPGRFHIIVPLNGIGFMVRLFNEKGELADKIKALTIKRAEAKGQLWDNGQKLVTSDLF